MCLPRETDSIQSCRCKPEDKVKVTFDSKVKVSERLATMATSIKSTIPADISNVTKYQYNIVQFQQIKTAESSDIINKVRTSHNNSQCLHSQHHKGLLSRLASSPITIPIAGSQVQTGSLATSLPEMQITISASSPSASSEDLAGSISSINSESLEVPNLSQRRVSDPGPSSLPSGSAREESSTGLWRRMLPSKLGHRDMNVLAPVSL